MHRPVMHRNAHLCTRVRAPRSQGVYAEGVTDAHLLQGPAYPGPLLIPYTRHKVYTRHGRASTRRG
jgi:hypothetical protein